MTALLLDLDAARKAHVRNPTLETRLALFAAASAVVEARQAEPQ